MRRILAFVVALSWLVTPVSAGALQPVTLERIDHGDAALVIAHPDGSEIRYSAAALETFPTFRLTTTTPWRAEPATFDGIRLTDLLRAHDLSEVAAISVEAENEYSVSIPREAWNSLDILVATRVNGAPISRRERGPIQFVIDMESYRASPIAREDYLVWMAARIAADK